MIVNDHSSHHYLKKGGILRSAVDRWLMKSETFSLKELETSTLLGLKNTDLLLAWLLKIEKTAVETGNTSSEWTANGPFCQHTVA